MKTKLFAALACVIPVILALAGCGQADGLFAPESIPAPSLFPQEARQVSADPAGLTMLSAADPLLLRPEKTDAQILAESVEEKLLARINAARKERSLAELTAREEVAEAARIRAEELQSDFSHIRPDGGAYHTAFDETGFSYSDRLHGENVCAVSVDKGEYDADAIAELLYDDLAASVGNTGNMLREKYTLAGVGVSVAESESGLAVASCQLFAN